MKVLHEKFFVLTTYGALLRDLNFIVEEHINCSIYLSAHEVLDDYKKDMIDKIRIFFDKNDLSIIVHAPFLDLNPGSLDKRIREISTERFIETLGLSKLLGSKYITFHSGFIPISYKEYRNKWLENSIEVWNKFIEIAEKEDIKINIENKFEKSPELLIKLVKKINSPNFNLCFDAGHFNAFSEMPPLEAFNILPAKKIGEIHLSDNDGSDDQHLSLGEGNIDLDALFKRIEILKIKPIFTLEPEGITGAEESLTYLKKKGIID